MEKRLAPEAAMQHLPASYAVGAVQGWIVQTLPDIGKSWAEERRKRVNNPTRSVPSVSIGAHKRWILPMQTSNAPVNAPWGPCSEGVRDC